MDAALGSLKDCQKTSTEETDVDLICQQLIEQHLSTADNVTVICHPGEFSSSGTHDECLGGVHNALGFHEDRAIAEIPTTLKSSARIRTVCMRPCL